MDAAKVAAIVADANKDVVKEPLGFIKILQFVLAIFAFATCSSSSSMFEISVPCNPPANTDIRTVAGEFSYPFNFDSQGILIKRNPCAGNSTSASLGNYSGSAEFFVAIGVLAFLYCIAALVIYIFFDNLYRKNDKIPIGDFLVTAIFTFMWLVSSSAWAKSLTDIKGATDPTFIIKEYVMQCRDAGLKCSVDKEPTFANSNVSVIFGFLNCALWGANLWFLFKETSWFKVRAKPAQDAATDPQKT